MEKYSLERLKLHYRRIVEMKDSIQELMESDGQCEPEDCLALRHTKQELEGAEQELYILLLKGKVVIL